MKLNLLLILLSLSGAVFAQGKLSEAAFLNSLNNITSTEDIQTICTNLNNHQIESNDYLNLFVTALESHISPNEFTSNGCNLPEKSKSKNLQKNVERLTKIKDLES